MKRAEIEKSWRQRGFSCSTWIDPPGSEWNDYSHNTDELIMVVDGDVELEMQGNKRLLNRGSEILIPKDTLHSVRNVGKQVAKWLYGYRYTN